jgi:hypothetical protein
MFIQIAMLLWAFNFDKPLGANGEPITPSKSDCVDAGVVVCVFPSDRLHLDGLLVSTLRVAAYRPPSGVELLLVMKTCPPSYSVRWRVSGLYFDRD